MENTPPFFLVYLKTLPSISTIPTIFFLTIFDDESVIIPLLTSIKTLVDQINTHFQQLIIVGTYNIGVVKYYLTLTPLD